MTSIEINIQINKEQEERLAEAYNNYIQGKDEFEEKTSLKVIKSLDNYRYCIIKNAANKFILGKVYKNGISIGSGTIIEYDKIEELESQNELDVLARFSEM